MEIQPPIKNDSPIKNDPNFINDPPVKNERYWNQTNEDGEYQLDDIIFTEDQFKIRYGTDEEKIAILDRQGMPWTQYR